MVSAHFIGRNAIITSNKIWFEEFEVDNTEGYLLLTWEAKQGHKNKGWITKVNSQNLNNMSS